MYYRCPACLAAGVDTTSLSQVSAKIPMTAFTCADSCTNPATSNITKLISLLDTAYTLGTSSNCSSSKKTHIFSLIFF